MVIDCGLTGVGKIEIRNRPRPKNPVKIIPITVSVFRPERLDRNSIAAAARPPDRNAPSAKGRPRI
jgi:hypothetical protein